MPLYEFECESCRTRIEVIQRFDDPPPTSCPSCDGPLRRLLSAPAVHFKGSGFYITDYAKKGAQSASTSSGADAKGSGGGGEGAAAGSSASDASTTSSASAPPTGGSSSATGEKSATPAKETKKS